MTKTIPKPLLKFGSKTILDIIVSNLIKNKFNYIILAAKYKSERFEYEIIRLRKYYPKIKAFIFGKKRNFFNHQLKGKVKLENFNNLKDAFKKILKLTKKEKIKKTILFSPSAASFDNFKNFEERGFYFDKLVKKYLNV